MVDYCRTVWHVGPDDDRIRSLDRPVEPAQIVDAVIESKRAEIRFRQVPMCRVPGLFSFQEKQVMPALMQRFQQRTISGGVPVAPGRTQAQPEEHEPHL